MVNINLMNSLEEKSKIVEEIYNVEEDLRLINKKIKEKESKIWTNTNFKELGYTNRDTRYAYVQSKIVEEKSLREQKHNILKKLKRQLEICNDKIKLFSI